MADPSLPPSPLAAPPEPVPERAVAQWRRRLKWLSIEMLIDSVPAAASITVYWIGTGISLADTLAQFRARPWRTVIPASFEGIPALLLGMLGLTLLAAHTPARARAVRVLLILTSLVALLDGAEGLRFFWDMYAEGHISRSLIARVVADLIVLGACCTGGRGLRWPIGAIAAAALVVKPVYSVYALGKMLPHVASLAWVLPGYFVADVVPIAGAILLIVLIRAARDQRLPEHST
jgi:hypothetical protein